MLSCPFSKQSNPLCISLPRVFTWVNKPSVTDVIHIPNCTTGSWSHPITMHTEVSRRIWRKKKRSSNNTAPVGNFLIPKASCSGIWKEISPLKTFRLLHSLFFSFLMLQKCKEIPFSQELLLSTVWKCLATWVRASYIVCILYQYHIALMYHVKMRFCFLSCFKCFTSFILVVYIVCFTLHRHIWASSLVYYRAGWTIRSSGSFWL